MSSTRTPQKKPRAHMLLLSSDIRARILRYIGLPQDDIVYVKARTRSPPTGLRGVVFTKGTVATFQWSSSGAKELRDVRGLLLSCRTLYREVWSLLLDRNTVVARDLNALTTMSPFTLRCLTRFTIHLDQVVDCRDRSHRRFRGLAHPPGRFRKRHTDNSRPNSKDVLRQWDRIFKGLASHASLDRLELSLICDLNPEDIETAERLMSPLNRLHGLKNCQIQLGAKPDYALQGIARRAVEKTKAKPAISDEVKRSKSRFRFFDLPSEIRLEILSYTDLVTPSKYVEWSRIKGYRYIPFESENSAPICHLDCPHVASPRAYSWVHPPKAEPCRNGCFCSRYRASYSDSCRCWRPPTPLFLVSRQFSEEARAVFHYYNDLNLITRNSGEGEPRLEPLLNILSPNMLPNLRWLQIDLYNLYRKVIPQLRSFKSMSDPWPENIADLQNSLQLRHLHVFIDATTFSYQFFFQRLNSVYPEMRERLADEDIKVSEIRKLISDHVWPLQDGEAPRGTRQLVVSIVTISTELVYYVRHESDRLPDHIRQNLPDQSYIHRESRISHGQFPIVEGYWYRDAQYPSRFAYRKAPATIRYGDEEEFYPLSRSGRFA